MPELNILTHPVDDAKASILLVHGYAEHCGRYDRFVNLLNDADYSVTRYDLRGHGKSGGDTAYVEDFDHYVEDLVEVHRQRASPDRPFVLFGHSMGGIMVLRSALTGKLSPAAIILSSPALAYHEPVLLQKAGAFASRFFPRLPTLPLDRKTLSRDPAVVKQAGDDPLYFKGRIKARTGSEMVRMANVVLGDAHQLTTPILIMHGAADRLIDPSGSQQLFASCSSSDKTLNLYPGGYHEILNDLDHEQVEADILEWLAARH